jgi:phosphate transport system protein
MSRVHAQAPLQRWKNGRKINTVADRAKHIRSSFDTALYGLRNDVLMMSSLTDRILQTAFEALLNRDSELCDHVVAEDEEIDVLEKQVDQDGVSLLLRFHPVASDMREVLSAMKISTDLERIGDQAVTIARRAKHLNNRPAVREVALLEPAYRLAAAIFRDSMRTFVDGDCELARTLKLRDRELDAVTRDLSERIVARATVDSELLPSYLDLIFVARALERIGDHATNIAEDSFWRDQATDIRHTYGPKKEE